MIFIFAIVIIIIILIVELSTTIICGNNNCIKGGGLTKLNTMSENTMSENTISENTISESLEKDIKLIKDIYIDGFIRVENNKMKGDQYNLTYGELTPEGMDNIIKYLENKNIKPKNYTFIDLGCGNGKTLAYAIIYGFKDALGTEIVESRYEYAIQKKQLLESGILANKKNRIFISNLDIFDLPNNYFPLNSIIFISNLLFPEETSSKIMKFLSTCVAKNTIVIISKLPNDLGKFSVIDQIQAPMSWSKESTCYILMMR